MLADMARQARHAGIANAGEDHRCSALALSRFFFLLGQAALQTLVHIEATTSQVRKQRMAAEKHAAEMSAQRMMAGLSGWSVYLCQVYLKLEFLDVHWF